MRSRSAQSIAEYFIIMVVVLAALLAVGFRDNIKDVFQKYFNKASSVITTFSY